MPSKSWGGRAEAERIIRSGWKRPPSEAQLIEMHQKRLPGAKAIARWSREREFEESASEDEAPVVAREEQPTSPAVEHSPQHVR